MVYNDEFVDSISFISAWIYQVLEKGPLPYDEVKSFFASKCSGDKFFISVNFLLRNNIISSKMIMGVKFLENNEFPVVVAS